MTPPFPFVVKFAVEMKMWSKDKQESKRANQPLEKAGRKETPFMEILFCPGKSMLRWSSLKQHCESLKVAFLTAATYTLGLI